jgi:integrase
LQGRYNLADNQGEMLFSKLVEEYNNYAMTNKISWKKDESRVKKLLEFFGNKKLREINPILIEKYRSERKREPKKNGKPLANASINRETSILRKMFNIALDNDWTNENPCLARRVKPLREDTKRERFLTPEEEKALMDFCIKDQAYMKAILICALHTGMRRGEILNLKWNYMDLKKGYLTVTKTKSGKDRNIPLSPMLIAEFKAIKEKNGSQYVFINPVTQKPYTNITKSFKTLLKKADIEGLVFHDLRHTAATRMVSSGIDLIVVQDILGHADIRTTMRYSHPVPQRKLDAIKALANFGKERKILAFKTNVQ